MKYLINNNEGIQCSENELQELLNTNAYFAILDDSNMLHIGTGPIAYLVPFASPGLCGSVFIKASNQDEAMELFKMVSAKVDHTIKAVGIARRIVNYGC